MSSITAASREKKAVRAAFALFDRDNKGYIAKEHVGCILRYLRCYPTEHELNTVILPRLVADSNSPQKAETVKYEVFGPFALSVMNSKVYEPDSESLLLAAFKALDKDGRGLIPEATLLEALKSTQTAASGEPLDVGFSDKEADEFVREATDPATGYVPYEKYVERSFAHLMGKPSLHPARFV